MMTYARLIATLLLLGALPAGRIDVSLPPGRARPHERQRGNDHAPLDGASHSSHRDLLAARSANHPPASRPPCRSAHSGALHAGGDIGPWS